MNPVAHSAEASSTAMVFATKLFTSEDQRRFAELSGDRNPIHLDPIVARRTQVGAPLVHGLHIVLWCLDAFASRCGRYTPAALEARFVMPVLVGDAVAAEVGDTGGREIRIQVKNNSTTVVLLRLAASASLPELPMPDFEQAQGPASPPRALTLEEMRDRSGRISFSATVSPLAAAFPVAARWLGPVRVAALASLSRLVGMECPGLHSLFSGFNVDFTGPGKGAELTFAVAAADARFRLIRMIVAAAGISGRIDAFARPPVVQQPSMEEVARLVSPGEFQDQRSLIVGGSRGLGETAAKIIAAGGGYPFITYAAGRDDALRVADELARWGAPCGTLQYDVLHSTERQRVETATVAKHVYYFATCPIARPRGRLFSAALLRDFMAFYVEGFNSLCAALAQAHKGGFSAFYPSSTFVTERPVGFTEYAMAKSAGEALCADMRVFFPNSRISIRRLPRLLTDQSAGVLPAAALPTLDILVPIVRDVQAA